VNKVQLDHREILEILVHRVLKEIQEQLVLKVHKEIQEQLVLKDQLVLMVLLVGI